MGFTAPTLLQPHKGPSVTVAITSPENFNTFELRPHKGPSVTRGTPFDVLELLASTPQGSVCNYPMASLPSPPRSASTPQGSVCNNSIVRTRTTAQIASTPQGSVCNRRWRRWRRGRAASTPQGSVCNGSNKTGSGVTRSLQPHKGPSVTSRPPVRRLRSRRFNPTRVRL